MKTKLFAFVTALLICVSFSFNSNAATSSDIKKENRNVGEFNEISLAVSANLYLTQGNTNEVIIEADEDVLEKIETEVSGGCLEIKFEKWYNYRGMDKINIYITTKDISKLTVSGSGDIISKSPIKTEKMGLIVTGSGSILIDDLNATKVYAMISGSGDIKIGGTNKGDQLDATITGSGDFESLDLVFAKAELTITGSGSIKSNVSDDLEATITGSGRIYYKGKPMIDANITGSGKIKRSDD